METLALGVDGERQGRAARQKPATGQSTNSRRQTSTPGLRERVWTPVVETCLLSWAEGWCPTGPPRQLAGSLPAPSGSGAQQNPLPCCLRLPVQEAWGRGLGLPSVEPSGKQDWEVVRKEVW